MIPDSTPYEVKTFDLHGLRGTSDKTMAMHYKLYAKYVEEANRLTQKVDAYLKVGEVAPNKLPEYTELMRRLSFECNGMKLHEYYFENLKNGGDDRDRIGPLFMDRIKPNFGSYEAWAADFVSAGKVRGVGWAICCEHPKHGRLSNHWIFMHDIESLTDLHPILVMDVWEHAYLFDYTPAQREKYIEDFFYNIDWTVVDKRLQLPVKVINEPDFCHTN